MHGTASAVIALWVLDSVVAETFAFEFFGWCCGNTGFDALAVAFPHVAFELEELLQAYGLQDWAGTLAKNTRGISSVEAFPAIEPGALEIQFGNTTTAHANE